MTSVCISVKAVMDFGVLFLQVTPTHTLSWMKRSTSCLPSSVNRELSLGCQVVECLPIGPCLYMYHYTAGEMPQSLSFFIPASPSQYASNPKAKQLSELGYDQRPLITEPPASQSVQVTTLAPSTHTTNTTNTTNTTPTLLRDPIILSYPSNDHVFISKSFLLFLLSLEKNWLLL